jgi:hypothetical protein
MKKILKIIILSLLLANVAHSETKEEKRAKYVLLNMQQDYIACYSFYKIGSEYVKKSNGDKSTIDGIEKSSDLSLKLAHDTGELMGMTIEEMSLKLESEMNKQLNLIDNNFSNASILLEKCAQNCKNLIENKKKRISFWEKKAKEKINE